MGKAGMCYKMFDYFIINSRASFFRNTILFHISISRMTICVLADLGVSSLVLDPPDDIYQIVDLYHRPKIS